MSKGPIKREITDSMLDDAYEVWVEEIQVECLRVKKTEGRYELDEILKRFVEERGIIALKKALKEKQRLRNIGRGR